MTNLESFSQFKNSFAYGARTDLNFKFLKALSEEEAAQFFQELLWKMGDFLDDGDRIPLVEHVRDWQTRAYSSQKPVWVYEDSPFTPLAKPLEQTRLALITSTGHFVTGDDPQPFGVEDMSQQEAIERIGDFLRSEPQLSPIPIDTPGEQLRVRHGGYDIRGAQADHNTVLPLDRLHELRAEGIIGPMLPTAYSFVGATAQNRLLNRSGPHWLARLKETGVEAALLIPVWPVCHVSVGHLARLLEEGGITTVVLAAQPFRRRLLAMSLPRLVLTPHPMGRVLGAPGDAARQRTILLAALELLQTAVQGNTLLQLPGTYQLE